MVMSVTSANFERTNSTENPVKTQFRSTMVEDSSNGSVLLYIYRDTSLDLDQ